MIDIEIYEPLWLTAEAKPEHIARRDSFWSGVVLYREKRWAEAYSEFQKARGPEEKMILPLQFYLRRLEPLVLQLTESPLEESSSALLRRTEYPAAIRNLIAQLRQMPGVGPRSAERIALWMVRARDDQAGANSARHHRHAAVNSILQALRIFCYRRNLRHMRRFLALDRAALRCRASH